MAKRRPQGDGTIRKRTDGRWEARIVVGHKSDGKPIFRSVFAKKQGELMPKLARLKEQYATVELTEESSVTLSEWLDKWITDYKKPTLRAQTVTGYESVIERHIKPYIGTKPLTRLKTADIQKLYNHLKESGRIRTEDGTRQSLSGTTVRGIHMVLREALDSAVREGLLPSNPADGTTLPRIMRKEKQVLRRDELERFMTILKKEPAWYDFFCTAIMTGIRQGELCGLRWEDFDEKNGTLRVARSVDYIHREPVIGETKTEDGKRTIYLPDSLWTMLKDRKKEVLSEWIFPSLANPDAPMNPSTAYRKLKSLLQKAELPMIRFHDLRHTFASHAANSGIEPKTLAEIVGHSRASFTLDTYAHVTGDMQEEAANIVANYITDVLGKELKPWQHANEKAEQVQ